MTIVVGILNVTPDSFSDGGRFASADDAVAEGVRLAAAGADWIDVGGESTRPGAPPVPEESERARVVPVIAALRRALPAPMRLSVDTYKAGTAEAALAAGADVINDVSGGLLEPAILSVAARAGAAVVLGHLRGAPATMMEAVHFDDVVREVGDELAARVAVARAAGCREVWADPGIGFGKHLAHNLTLLRGLAPLRARVGAPLMVGVSRKRFVGELTGREVGDRAFGTAAAVALSVALGADAVRVHDVAAARDVVAVASAIAGAEAGGAGPGVLK